MKNKNNNVVDCLYNESGNNQEITLVEDLIELGTESSKVDGNGRVFVRLLPEPQILIKANFHSLPFDLIDMMWKKPKKPRLFVAFPSLPLTTEITMINLTAGIKGYKIIAQPNETPLIIGPKNSPTKIIFHLLNFPNFMGTEAIIDTKNGKSSQREKIKLEVDDW